MTILWPMRRLLFVLGAISLLPLLMACTLLQQITNTAPNTAVTETATSPATTPQAQTTPTLTTPEPVTDTSVTLIVWLPVEFSPTGSTGSAVLEEQIRSYDDAHGELRVRLEYKNVTGQGGMMRYLRTGHNVAPSILPDLIVLPTEQLATAVSDRIIYALDPLLDNNALDPLYPVARSLVSVNNTVAAYPFAITNLTHLAYRTTITGTVPATWEQLRNTPGNRFVFPASGPDGVNHLLQLYLQAGGQLLDEEGTPILQASQLAQALEQFNLARADGVILRQSNSISTMNEAWQQYDSNAANIVLTSAHEYLRRRHDLANTDFAPVMGLTEPPAPMVNGWAWAISTQNSSRQALAVDLLAQLTTAENMAAWSVSANMLPAREDAFALWPDPDEPYLEFLQQALAQAIPHTTPATSRTFSALANALSDVITLTETPQIAAAEAAAAVQR